MSSPNGKLDKMEVERERSPDRRSKSSRNQSAETHRTRRSHRSRSRDRDRERERRHRERDGVHDEKRIGTMTENATGVGTVTSTAAVATETGQRADTVNGTVSATGTATATTATIATDAGSVETKRKSHGKSMTESRESDPTTALKSHLFLPLQQLVLAMLNVDMVIGPGVRATPEKSTTNPCPSPTAAEAPFAVL
ncbi:hypothetical protein BC628DRAFT_284802 [Trametes gibbosa]|nr:hypothetical protein BC628DRAFT_284802 [Trametes gibbosa]